MRDSFALASWCSLLSLLAGCSRSADATQEQAAPEPAPITEPAPQEAAKHDGAGDNQVTEAAGKGDTNAGGALVPELGEVRKLEGTGIELALPKGATRLGRLLTYQTPGKRPITIELLHQNAALPASTAVQRGVLVYGSAEGGFETKESPRIITTEPERAVLHGYAKLDLFASPLDDAQPNMMAARSEQGHLLFVRASYSEPARDLMDEMVATLQIEPEAELEPLRVYGIDLDVPTGYQLQRGQLHPIVVLPAGTMFAEGQPSVDIRIGGPGQTQELLSGLKAVFQSEPETTECTELKAVAAKPPVVAHTTQRCSFETPRLNGYHVVLDVYDDEQGGFVAITSLPSSGAEQHRATFAKMIDSLRPVQVPKL